MTMTSEKALYGAVQTIAEWLASIGLAEYIQCFADSPMVMDRSPLLAEMILSRRAVSSSRSDGSVICSMVPPVMMIAHEIARNLNPDVGAPAAHFDGRGIAIPSAPGSLLNHRVDRQQEIGPLSWNGIASLFIPEISTRFLTERSPSIPNSETRRGDVNVLVVEPSDAAPSRAQPQALADAFNARIFKRNQGSSLPCSNPSSAAYFA
jgi:hypothetical protein